VKRNINHARFYLFATMLFCLFLYGLSPLYSQTLKGSKTDKKIARKVQTLLKAAEKYEEKGVLTKAIEACWLALQADPQKTEAYLRISKLYESAKMYDKAAELLSSGLAVAGSDLLPAEKSSYYCKLAKLHMILKQTGEINKTLLQAVEADPTNPEPREILGDIFMNYKRYANAARAYKIALELSPDSEHLIEKLNKIKAINPKAYASVMQEAEKKIEQKIAQKIEEKKEMARLETQKKQEETWVSVSSSPAQPASSDGIPVFSQAPQPSTNIQIPKGATPEEEIEFLLDFYMYSDLESDKSAAISKVTAYGEAGLSAVEDFLYHEYPEVRIQALQALPAFTEHKNLSKAIAKDMQDDPSAEVAKLAKQIYESL